MTVNDTSPAQKWDGFGGAFNEIGWNVLTSMTMQTQAMTMLFSGTDGANFAWGRIPIGASDYATSRYTCDDTGTDVTPSSSNRPAADTTMATSRSPEMARADPVHQGSAGGEPQPPLLVQPLDASGLVEDRIQFGQRNQEAVVLRRGQHRQRQSSYLTAYAPYYTNSSQGTRRRGSTSRSSLPRTSLAIEQNYPSCLWDKPRT